MSRFLARHANKLVLQMCNLCYIVHCMSVLIFAIDIHFTNHSVELIHYTDEMRDANVSTAYYHR